MDKKLVIWIIGGNCSGKTTLARALHKYFNGLCSNTEDYPILRKFSTVPLFKKNVESIDYCFTSMNPISANLGNLKNNACSGADTLQTKEQMMLAFNHALEYHPVVVLEPIMSTMQYRFFLKTDKTIVVLIHLKLSEKQLFLRLRQRRGKRLNIPPTEVQIKPKTIENMTHKLGMFQNQYNGLKDKVDYAMEIDTTALNESDVHEYLIQQCENIIISNG